MDTSGGFFKWIVRRRRFGTSGSSWAKCQASYLLSNLIKTFYAFFSFFFYHSLIIDFLFLIKFFFMIFFIICQTLSWLQISLNIVEYIFHFQRFLSCFHLFIYIIKICWGITRLFNFGSILTLQSSICFINNWFLLMYLLI